MSGSSKPLWFFALLVFASLVFLNFLWSGYTRSVDRGLRDRTNTREGVPFDFGNDGDPIAEAIQGAIDFAQDVLAQCGSSFPHDSNGNPILPSDISNKLQELEDNKQICLETNDQGNQRSLAVSSNAPEISLGGVRYQYNSGDEGININDRLVFSPMSEDDSAFLASILVHEAFHLLYGDTGTPEQEPAALEAEAEFICCAIDYATNKNMDPAVLDALCWRLNLMHVFYFFSGGSGTLPDCGCFIIFPWLGNHSPGQSLAFYPPQGSRPSIPRQPLGGDELLPSQAIYRTANGLFVLVLVPSEDLLLINRLDGLQSKHWSLDLAPRQEGEFQPLALSPSEPGQVFVAGRIEGANEGIIYRVRIQWGGSAPAIHIQAAFQDPTLGDTTSLDYVNEVGDLLIGFDFTNAQIRYYEISTGLSAVVADPASYPDLLDMVGLFAFPSENTLTGNVDTLCLFLQAVQQYVENPQAAPGLDTLQFYDRLANGSFEGFVKTTY